MNISDYLSLDANSPTGLVWVKKTAPTASMKVGTPAFTTKSGGYFQGGFGGKKLYAHRVVFFLSNGYWPEYVDHIDGNRENNSPSNLREATVELNNQNRKASGGYFCKEKNKWRVYIRASGKKIFVGDYDSKAEAENAYVNAKHQYHPTSTVRV